MNAGLKRAVLRVLEKCDGLPMPEDVLLNAMQLMVRPSQPTVGDASEALKACEADGFCAGVTDELTGERSWTLTAKGIHKARQL